MNRLFVIATAAGFLLANCTPTPVSSSGGASETVATVSSYEQGIRVSVSGTTDFAVNAEIFHNGFTSEDTGHFREAIQLSNDLPDWNIPVLPESTYNVFIVDTLSGNGAFFQYDNRDASRSGRQSKKITPLGGVSGVVTLKLSGSPPEPARGNKVVISGSNFFATTDDSGSYLISNVPEGTYRLEVKLSTKVYSREGDSDTIEISGGRINSLDLNVNTN